MPAARAVLEAEARNSAGAAQGGVSVYVFEPDGVTPLGQVMYSSLNGSVTLLNPLVSDTNGRVQAYVATGQRCVLRVGASGPVFTSEFEPDPAAFVIGGAGQGLIVNADVAAAAGLLPSKLAAGGTANRVVGTTDGAAVTLLQIVDAMIASAAAIALTKLSPGAANQALLTNAGATAVVAALIANANIDPAAAIALTKLAAGSAGLLRSNGTAIAAGNQAQAGDYAAGSIATADIAANATTQSGQAVGSSSAPTTTSASFVDLTDMSLTLTTTGGPLLCWFSGTFLNSTTGLIQAAFGLDGAAEVAIQTFQSASANIQGVLSLVWRFTGVSAGSHTVKVRWLTNTGTATAVTTQRVLVVQELKR